MNISEMKQTIKAIMKPVMEIGLKQDQRKLALQRGDWETAQKIKEELKNYKKPSISAIGEAGIGKTEAVVQVATELGIPCLPFRVGEFVDNGDIQGMPRIVEVNGMLTTATILPQFYPLPVLNEDGSYKLRKDGGIMYDYESIKEYIKNYDEIYEYYKGEVNEAPGLLVFYDEVNRVAGEDVKNALFKIMEEYGIGKYRYPNGSLIVAATNPNTDDYGVQAILEEKAFKTRFVHLFVEGDNNIFIDYLRNNQFHTGVINFVRQKQSEINVPGNEYDLDIKPNSRTIAFANTFIQYLKLHETLPTELFNEVMSGIVGGNAYTLTDILNNKFKEKIEPEEIIYHYDMIENDFMALMDDGEVDRLIQIKDDMIDYLFSIENSEERIKLFEENKENFEKFVTNFADEYTYAFFTELTKKDMEDESGVEKWNQIFAKHNGIANRVMELGEKASEFEEKK